MRINNWTDYRGYRPPPRTEKPTGHPGECSCFGRNTRDCEAVITKNTLPEIKAGVSALEEMQGTLDAQRLGNLGAQLARIQNELGPKGFANSPYLGLTQRYAAL